MTQKAKKDLANIYNYIAKNSPNYAKEKISCIYILRVKHTAQNFNI